MTVTFLPSALKGARRRRREQSGRAGVKALPRRVLRRLVAWWIVYPFRSGALAAFTAVYFGAGLYVALCVCALVGAGAGAWRGILRRSRRDPLQLNPLVKSLRLRRRVRKRWDRAMREAGLEKATRGGEPRRPRRGRRVRLTPYGVVTRVNGGPVGATADVVRGKREAIEAVVRADDTRVVSTGPGWMDLHLRHTDPLTTATVRTSHLPRSTRPGLVVTGVDEDRRGVERDPVLPSLVCGAQGSGKSTEAWTMLFELLEANIPLRLYVFDPKIQEFSDLKDKAHHYENNALKWGDFLGKVITGMMRRQAELARRGIRTLTLADASIEFPLAFVLVDELVTVLTMRGVKVPVTYPDGSRVELKADDALLLFLSQARAALYGFLALTQIGTKDVLGPIRSLFAYATCLRVGTLEADMVDVMLGSGASKAYPAHKLDPLTTAGIGWRAGGATGEIVRYRAAMLTEHERKWTVKAIGEETSRLASYARSKRHEREQEQAQAPEHVAPTLQVVEGGSTRRRAPRRTRGGKSA